MGAQLFLEGFHRAKISNQTLNLFYDIKRQSGSPDLDKAMNKLAE